MFIKVIFKGLFNIIQKIISFMINMTLTGNARAFLLIKETEAFEGPLTMIFS